MYKYNTKGSCSKAIDINLEGNTISSVEFHGGCYGNSQGVARLVEGMDVDRAISLLSGINCRNGTSCPDQLSRALRAIKEGRIAATQNT